MKVKSAALYLDPDQPVEARIDDLVSRMTLEEKIREMSMQRFCKLLKKGKFSYAYARQIFKDMGTGGVDIPLIDPQGTADAINKLQAYMKNNTRLGIPALVIAETLHGLMSPGATVFPQAIGLASTWNTGLIREIASCIAKEARSLGVTQGLAPDLDLAREPRWGRVEETYGEDPFLCGRIGVEYVNGLQGLQGNGLMVDCEHIAATVKHFAAHGSPEGGINLSPVSVGERQLRELYLLPFKEAIIEAGAKCIMPAYSELDGIPCSTSKQLLTQILREEWGFKGYVISDGGAIEMLVSMHHTAQTLKQAGKQAIEAGMDMEIYNSHAFGEEFLELVKKGQIDEKLIDNAVSRILRVKFQLGLFENPYVKPEHLAKVVNCKSHKELALKAAHESVVLLKNENTLLPLDNNIESIAVIGPNADIAQLGDYSVEKESSVTLLQGIVNKVSSQTKVIHTKGCGIYESSKAGFSEAIEAARNSKAAIIAVGEASMTGYGIGWGIDTGKVATCGEGFDRSELSLPGIQQELVEAVVNTGTPTIVVLINGRPLSITWIAENVTAIIEAWYPGEDGGNAIADIIFGKVTPSGKLPVSFPKAVGQAPVYYNCKPSARGYYHNPGSPLKPGRDYVFMDTEPLFEFGYGLSYTKFEYSELSVKPIEIDWFRRVNISVNVKNIGDREGLEVVQLYINDVVSSVTTPVRVLKGFKKVNLAPGETCMASFVLSPEDLSLVDEFMKTVVEPGTFEVMIGGLKGTFEVK